MTTIERILNDKGPLLSSDLAKFLLEEHGISSEAVRKQISRSKPPVNRISGFFLNNQSFFYLEHHKDTNEYANSLITALRQSAKRLFSVIRTLQNNFGCLPIAEIANFTFSPVQNLKGHKRFDAIALDLLELDLITIDLVEGYYYLNDKLFEKKYINLNRSRAIEFSRKFILNQLIDWSKSLGFISFDKGKINSEFSKFHWCLTAPSYIGTISGDKYSGKPTAFLVADVVIGKNLKEEDAHFFIEKVRTIKSMRSLSPILPILVVESVSHDILINLKKHGIIVGFVDKLFGKGYSELLKMLVNTVANAGAILKKNPDAFFQLLEKIDALVDGKTNNLRGDLFEMAVGYFHSKRSQTIDVGKIIRPDGLQRELDVVAVYEDKVVIAECKGAKRAFSLEEVEDWSEKVQLARRWLESIEVYADKKHVFELWAIGGFDESALKRLHQLANAKKYDFLFFDQNEIQLKVKETKDKKFLKILKDYFIHEPV